jgi:hypothetical protein
MKSIYYISIVLLLYSCSEPGWKGKKEIKQVKETSVTKTDFPLSSVSIMKVGECEYVFWENSYGSDMEHYEGCSNPKHDKSH